MTARTARAFLPTLREVERELTVPLPERVRILQELEFDLEEFQERLVAEGLSERDAREKALDVLVPHGVALQALESVHEPIYVRVTRRLRGIQLEVLERRLLLLSVAMVLLAETVALFQADLLDDPSPFLLPLLVVGGVLFAATTAKTFQLLIKRDHAAPQSGLGAILGLSIVTLGIGLGGTIFDLYRLAAVLEREPALAETVAIGWLIRDAALLAVALILSLAGGLAWFLLKQWVVTLTSARADALGLKTTPPSFNHSGDKQ